MKILHQSCQITNHCFGYIMSWILKLQGCMQLLQYIEHFDVDIVTGWWAGLCNSLQGYHWGWEGIGFGQKQLGHCPQRSPLKVFSKCVGCLIVLDGWQPVNKDLVLWLLIFYNFDARFWASAEQWQITEGSFGGWHSGSCNNFDVFDSCSTNGISSPNRFSACAICSSLHLATKLRIAVTMDWLIIEQAAVTQYAWGPQSNITSHQNLIQRACMHFAIYSFTLTRVKIIGLALIHHEEQKNRFNQTV